VSEAIDLIGQYQDAGVQLPINSDYRNDMETHELFASKVMPLETRKRITTLIGSDRGSRILTVDCACGHRRGTAL